MNTYIELASVALMILGIIAIAILYGNPEVFRVPLWVKTLGYLNFIIDMAGALMIFGHFRFAWPLIAHNIGTAMILTSGTGLLCVFVYVHALIIPGARKGVK